MEPFALILYLVGQPPVKTYPRSEEACIRSGESLAQKLPQGSWIVCLGNEDGTVHVWRGEATE